MKKMNMKTIIDWLYGAIFGRETVETWASEDRAMTVKRERRTAECPVDSQGVSAPREFAERIKNSLKPRRPREDRAMNHSVYRPVSVPYVARISLVSLFLLVLGGWNSEAWGYWTTDKDGNAQVNNASIKGYVSNSGSTYYVLDASKEESVFQTGSHTYNLSGPGAQLTFEAKCQLTAVQNLEVSDGYSVIFDEYVGKYRYVFPAGTMDYVSYGPKNVNVDAKNIKFYGATAATLSRYFKNVKVTMASYCEPETTTVAFGSKNIGTDNENKSVKIYWSNTASKTISASGNTDRFVLSTTTVASKAGYFGNTVVTITYKHDVAGEHSMTLTVNGKTITVTGTTNKLANTISWDVDVATKKNWGQTVSMNATATNTNYSGDANSRPITYSVESGKESYVTIADGKITFNQAGAGKTVKITASQATNYRYKAASLTKEFAIKSTQVLSYNNTNVIVSVSVDDKFTINLNDSRTSHTGDGAITYSVKSGSGAVLSENTFYSTVANTCVITATAANTANYETCSTDFTVTVNKRTPTFVWRTFDHIYSGAVLANLAQAQYNGANVGGLSYTYSSNNTTAAVVDGTTVRVPTTGFTTNQDARISVTTAETDFYLEGSSYHDYLIEPKKSPVFKLNGNVIADGATATIDLLIGQTATVSFENIDNTEATFTKPNNPSFVTYAHNSSTHTGVITATAFGTTNLTFSQAGNDTIFGHTGYVTVNVKKHPVALATTLNGITWEVEDSVTTEGAYSIVTSPVDGHPFANVTIVSDNEEVVRFVDGKWRAKKDGNATLSIRMPANVYWTGDTITAALTVNKKTPAITWHLNDNYLWGARINEVVSSTNEDIEYSVTSNNPTVANYVDGSIEVYNKSGDVTFTLSQASNYKWNAASANLTKTIHVSQPDNHVEYSIGNVELKKDKSTVYAFTGVAKTVKFTPSSKASTDRNYNLYWSSMGADDSYSLFASYTQDQEDVEHEDEIPASAKYLKVEFDGSYWMNEKTTGTFGGLTITARTGIEAPASVAYGMRYMGNNPTVRDIDVDWYSVQPCTITLQGANADRFQIKEGDNTISNAALDHFGTKTVEVSYKHDVEGSHTAILHIQSADGKTANVTLTGSTEKAVQQIIWSDEVSPVNRNILIPDAATATSQLDVVLTAEDETIVSVSNGNEITGLKEGTTRVFAYQAGDTKWASIRDTIEVIVTDKKVQHIVWNDRLLNVKRENNQTKTVTLTAYSDADNTLPITYSLDAAARAFASVSGNTLTITGWGRGTITATQAGNDEYVGLSKTMKIIARNPDAGCNPLVLDDAAGATLHTIDSETRSLDGEPRTIEFDASCTWSAVNGLYVGEYYDKSWHEVTYIARTGDNNITSDEKHFGPFNLHRNATAIKLYSEFGATMTRTFRNVKVTQAKYLELDENATDFSRMEVGQVEMQQISVNYSNLTGTLDVELKNPSTQFTVMTQTLGENCGETVQGALVTVRCIGKREGTENNVVILSNKNQRLEVPISATVSKLSQTITWNVASTVNVNTTDEVALAATATSELPVSFSSSDNATAEAYQKGDGTWALRIYKAGTITLTASQAGNANYGATATTRTYVISRTTPEITVLPTAATVSLPATLADVDLTGGEASVAGTFTWQNSATSVDRFNSGYTVLFTPENTNWYNTATCNVVVPVNKDAQTITWNFSETEIYCDADITFDASASSRLAVRYTSSNASIAYVDEDNKLKIVCGGEVTITAYQDGNETFLAATPVAKMLTIKKFTPEVTAPTAAAIKKGKLLDNATLSGGAATSNGNEVEGIFTWENGSEAMNTAGTFSRTVLFTPSNTNYYNVVRMDVDVEVQKFSPAIEHTLTASAITYGAALSTSELSGTLTATDTVKVPSVVVKGTYAWLNGEAILDAGNPTSATVRFTPTESDQYNTVDFEVSIVVNKAAPVLSVTASNIASYQTLSQSVLTNDGTPGVCAWDAALNATTAKYAAGDHVLAYTFTPNSTNYLSASGTATVHVEKGCVLTNNAEGGWNLASNWENNEQPDEDTHVLVQTNIEISHEIVAKSLNIDEGATVTIAPTGGLTIGDGGITNATKENLILKAKLEDDGEGDRGQTAFLRISPEYTGAMPEVTMEMLRIGYSASYTQDNFNARGVMAWQYMGAPIDAEETLLKSIVGGWINSWDEATGTWVNNKSTARVAPFVGFANSQSKSASGAKTQYKGTIVENKTHNVPLSYHEESEMAGWNLLANSFTAPIEIAKMLDDIDEDEKEPTIYLFNTGSTSAVDGDAGTYVSVPIANAGKKIAEVTYPGVIPAMQGFFVKAKKEDVSLKLDYSKIVWGATSPNTPMRVKAKDEEESPIYGVYITLMADGARDNLHIIESEDFTPARDKGYDAAYMPVGGLNIFAVENEEDYLAVDATNSIIGTKIGVRTGEEFEYTMKFSHVIVDHSIALFDKEMGEVTPIYEGTEYIFYAEPNEVISERFEIVERFGAPNVTTGNDGVGAEVNAQKFIKDNSLYIYKDGVLFNALGERVR